MPKFDVEMLWDCSSCNTHGIGGTNDHCSNCGNAHDTKKDPWYMPEDLSLKNQIKDYQKIQMAHAGPNWSCQFCGGTQRRPNGSCLNCAGPRDESVAEKIAGRSSEEPVQTRASYITLLKTQALQVQKSAHFYRAPKRGWWKIAAMVIVAVIFIAGLAWVLFHQRPVDLEVTAVEWTHSVHVERYKQVSGEGFDEDQPSDAQNVRNQGSRVHHNETVHFTVQVPDGQDCRTTTRSCYTTAVRCSPNNNGTASCSGGDEICSGGDQVCTPRYRNEDRTREEPVYRDEPRYEDYYTWTVWRWKPEREIPHSGRTLQTDWPSSEEICLNCGCTEGEQERESGRSVSYAVKFVDKRTSERFSHAPASDSDFKRFPLGSTHQALYSVALGLDFQSALK